MVEDKQLLRQYAGERSETAFAELVRRHLKMVYAAALRQVHGDAPLAEDVTQTVFADLARKAKMLQDKASIAGWLFVSTRFAAANAVRAEARRRLREHEVMAMNEIAADGNEDWNKLRPLIDEALSELGETDRESIALRFFQGYEFSLVGATLGVSENAARMRVERALAEATGGSVPAQLAGIITKAALAQTGLAATATPSILNLLAMNKIAATVAGLAVLTIAGLMVKHKSDLPGERNVATAIAPSETRTLGENVAVVPTPVMETNANAFQKAVEGHDAQVRAHRGTNSQDGEGMDLAGVHKFTASIRITVPTGQTLVAGDWQTGKGRRTMAFVTPTWIDPAGNRLDSPATGATPPEVTIDTKFASMSDSTHDLLVTNYFAIHFAAQHNSSTVEVLSDERFRSMINFVQQRNETDLLSAPRVTTEAGRQGHAGVENEVTLIGGQKAVEGPHADFLPRVAEDGVSVDLTVIVGYTAVDQNVVVSTGTMNVFPQNTATAAGQ